MQPSSCTFPDLSTHRRAWNTASLTQIGSWTIEPDPDLEAAFDRIVTERHPTTSVTALERRDLPRNTIREMLRRLEGDSGLVLLRVSPERYRREELLVLYWLIGQALARPFAQNVEGTLLYDVRNTGKQLSEGARFSVTNYESSFHTDNSFGEEVLDYVGLLCLQAAKSGGVSQLVSGYSVYNVLQREYPEELAILCAPFHVDRRGGVKAGQEPTACFPVISWLGEEPHYRYLRYWIQVGHEKAGKPLTAAQVRALDTLDTVAQRPELRIEFTMRPGEMLFINNRWLLHNRTAFEDHEELEQRRHYVRLWLQRKAA